MKKKILHQLKTLLKIPKLMFLGFVFIIAVVGTSWFTLNLQKQSHAEYVKKERDAALVTIESALKLSKSIKSFYEFNGDENKLAQLQGEFSLITDQMEDLKKARTGTDFIRSIRDASRFYRDYCDARIDQLNALTIMKLDSSLNNHVNTKSAEFFLKSRKEYVARAFQYDNAVLQTIQKAFSEWNEILSPEDCHMVFGYIDDHFESEKKKLSLQRDNDQEPKLFNHEWIAMQINEEVFNRWMKNELSDLLNSFSSSSLIGQEIDNE